MKIVVLFIRLFERDDENKLEIIFHSYFELSIRKQNGSKACSYSKLYTCLLTLNLKG